MLGRKCLGTMVSFGKHPLAPHLNHLIGKSKKGDALFAKGGLTHIPYQSEPNLQQTICVMLVKASLVI
jgi:hypothetical protein